MHAVFRPSQDGESEKIAASLHDESVGLSRTALFFGSVSFGQAKEMNSACKAESLCLRLFALRLAGIRIAVSHDVRRPVISTAGRDGARSDAYGRASATKALKAEAFGLAAEFISFADPKETEPKKRVFLDNPTDRSCGDAGIFRLAILARSENGVHPCTPPYGSSDAGLGLISWQQRPR